MWSPSGPNSSNLKAPIFLEFRNHLAHHFVIVPFRAQRYPELFGYWTSVELIQVEQLQFRIYNVD